MDIPECCVCYEGVNDSTRRPRFLPCGHTICTLCIDRSIEKGDKTCPSCRKPHHVAAASKLPINYALEEVFQKLTVKSPKATGVNIEMYEDVRKKKENIISETRDCIYSLESSVIEWQKELRMKEGSIDNNQDLLDQKLAEVECLKMDIQEDNNAKQGLEEKINGSEEKIKFLENSVKNIRSSKTSANVQNIYEEIKRNVNISTISEDDVMKKDLQPSRIVKLLRIGGKLGFCVAGGSDFDLPIFISGINPGGAADMHGGFKVEDNILSANGVSVEGKSKDLFNEILNVSTGEITLEVRYTPGTLEKIKKKYQSFGRTYDLPIMK